MDWVRWWRRVSAGRAGPEHLRRGAFGEAAARRHLENRGLRFLAANYRSEVGEIDLIMRDGPTLVFVEVKARSSEAWGRPADAVDRPKRLRLSDTALAYLEELGHPRVPFRFDIVEVLDLGGEEPEVRHLENAFPLEPPRMYA
jgi:putative endonuclease